MGQAYLNKTSGSAIFAHPAIKSEHGTVLLGGYGISAGISGLHYTGFGIIVPAKSFHLNGFVFRTGDEFLNENQVSLGVSQTLGITHLGLRTNLIQSRVQGFGQKNTATIDLGGITRLSDKVLIGASIYNLNLAKQFSEERYPVLLRAGLAISPHKKVTWVIEAEQDIDYDPVFKTGIELLLLNALNLRSGVITDPPTLTGGVGFESPWIIIDYAIYHQHYLGISQQVMLSYHFKKS